MEEELRRELEETSARHLREVDEMKKLYEQHKVSGEIYLKADKETRIKLAKDLIQLQRDMSKASEAALKSGNDKSELDDRYLAYVERQRLLRESLSPRPSLTQGVLQGYNYTPANNNCCFTTCHALTVLIL